jgi:hypothetical protein
MVRSSPWKVLPRQKDSNDSNWNVYQENCAPSGRCNVSVNYETADDWTQDSTKSKYWAEDGKNFTQLFWWENIANESNDVWQD